MEDPSVSTISFAYRTYDAGSSIVLHSHAYPSLTIVLGGGYEEEIAGRSGTETRGSALVCPADVPHAQRFGTHGARKIIVTPSGDLLDYLTGTMPFQSAPVARSTAIGRLAARIDAERRTNDPFSRAAIEGLIWQASPAHLCRPRSSSSARVR